MPVETDPTRTGSEAPDSEEGSEEEPAREREPEREPGPESPPAAPSELVSFADAPPDGLAEALFDEDRETASALLERATPTRATACVEAALRDQALRERYLPSRPPVDRLSVELFEVVRAEWVDALATTTRAYARCIAGASALARGEVAVARRGGVATVHMQTLWITTKSRLEALSEAARGAASADAFLAHAAIRGVVEDTADDEGDEAAGGHAATPPWSWDAAVAWYVAEHGRLPLPEEPKREPEWRLTPLLVGVMELSLALAMVPASFRTELLDDARARLALVGVALGGFVAMVLGPTWSERRRRDRLISSGLLLVASAALGLGTALADVRPRLRAFGAALTASSIVNLGLWSGGAVIQRRWRPIASISAHHGALGCRVSF